MIALGSKFECYVFRRRLRSILFSNCRGGRKAFLIVLCLPCLHLLGKRMKAFQPCMEIEDEVRSLHGERHSYLPKDRRFKPTTLDELHSVPPTLGNIGGKPIQFLAKLSACFDKFYSFRNMGRCHSWYPARNAAAA